MPKQHRLQITLFRRAGHEFNPHAQRTLFGRLKVILGGLLLASLVTGLLIIVVALGSVLALVIGVVAIVGVATMIVWATMRNLRSR
jgi:Flp pilus assembly protein TadB